MDIKFYICPHCGRIISDIKDQKVPVMCCGVKMQKLKANTTEAATEKHVPVVVEENETVTVKVGEVPHPMTEAHFIKFIALITNRGYKVNFLKPDSAPETTFALVKGEKVKKVYAYCNLHSLWANK